MRIEPATKRTAVFVDGQNLFHAAKAAFGYTYPNYDISRLAATICVLRAWQLNQVRFYTGVPEAADNPSWNRFWIAKLAQMGRERVHVYSRALRYRLETVRLRDGSSYSTPVAQEKGVDVRIALDIVGMAWRREYDVALVFSQDQDLSEVADEIRGIAHEQDRWIKIAGSNQPRLAAQIRRPELTG